MATPIALSVENCGCANTASMPAHASRSIEFDATPPENTTGSPGYRFRAASVVRRMHPITEPSAYRAVSAALCPPE